MKLTDDDIVHNCIWQLRAQLFYAKCHFEVLKLPDDHILRKGTWLLNKQFFYAEKDITLKFKTGNNINNNDNLKNAHAQLFYA